MSRFKILISQNQAGLYAAAGETYEVIETSKRKFDRCASAYDAYFLAKANEIGSIDVREDGWLALAERRED